MYELKAIIEPAFDRRAEFTPEACPSEVRDAVAAVVAGLDDGTLRVAEKVNGTWTVHEWIKKGVLLYFRIMPNRVVDGGFTRFWDKVPLKHTRADSGSFARDGVRVVPHAVVRYGSFIEPDVVLMPSYVNIGARIGRGTMIDTWATVGSCAQIGANVHISGGVGIGGVLEPLQATPTIVEDDCFIGARSEIVEGVVVERGAVISMGVYIGRSTRIYDREHDEVIQGRVPAGSVVVPGTLPAENGKYGLYAAIIVKRVDDKTRARVGINELLRQAK